MKPSPAEIDAFISEAIRRGGTVSPPRGAREKVHKYRAQPTEADGIRFASKKEAKRYGELKALEAAGTITGLRLQPRFPLHAPDGTKIGEYVADFSYLEDGKEIVEDVKGVKTPMYRWKSKHARAEHGIDLREV